MIFHYSLKILSIVGFLSMGFFVFLITKVEPPQTYEMYFFQPYSAFIDFIVVAILLLGFILLIFGPDAYNSKTYLSGYLILVVFFSLCISLPYIRGYEIYGRDDVLTHFGFIKDLINNGRVGYSNFYPISHIQLATLSYLFNISFEKLLFLMQIIYYIIYTTGIYITAHFAFKRFNARITTALGCIPLFTYFNSLFLPTYFAFCLAPLIIYLLVKAFNSSLIAHHILLLILLILMPFFHPFASSNLLAVLLIFGLSIYIANSYFSTQFTKLMPSKILLPTLILFTSFFSWFSSSVFFAGSIRQLYVLFVERGLESLSQKYEMAITKFLNVREFTFLLIQSYGHEIVYLILASAFSLYIIRDFKNKKTQFEALFFVFLFVIFLFSTFFLFFSAPVVFSNPLRELKWALLPATFINGIYISTILYTQTNKHVKIIYCSLLILLLTFSGYIGIYSLHSSILMRGGMNAQVTRSEVSGMKWLLEHRNNSIPTYSHLNDSARLVDSILGVEASRKMNNAFIKSPPHFAIKSNGYLMITAYLKSRFTIWRPYGADIESTDFDKLLSLRNYFKVYNNNDTELFFIK